MRDPGFQSMTAVLHGITDTC